MRRWLVTKMDRFQLRTERLAARRRAVLDYVREHPCCTAREVAVSVFGGSGATRTSSRDAAYKTLCWLEMDGRIIRDRIARMHTWEAIE